MKKIKISTLPFVIAVSLLPFTVFSQPLAEKESEPLKKQDSADYLGIKFNGYARYGFHYAENGNDFVAASGQAAGIAVGRLGNETNGGEVLFSRNFKASSGAKWEVGVMLDNYSKEQSEQNDETTGGDSFVDNVGNADVYLRQFYAGVSNVFKFQPDLYIWAGRVFHQRPQESLNDYFFMVHDGQGAGFKNLTISGMKFDLGFVGQSNGDNFTSTGDNGNYAITSRFGVSLGQDKTLDFLANFGLSDHVSPIADVEYAYQVGSILNWSGSKFSLRYAANADNSVFDRTSDMYTIYASWQSDYSITKRINLQYLLAYHNTSFASENALERSNYSAILRPMYAWNDTHSTWMETGYSLVDYAQAGESNNAWKVTLSQNIALNAESWGRPMIRFYATTGKIDNRVNTEGKLAITPVKDVFAIGAMFEAWW